MHKSAAARKQRNFIVEQLNEKQGQFELNKSERGKAIFMLSLQNTMRN